MSVGEDDIPPYQRPGSSRKSADNTSAVYDSHSDLCQILIPSFVSGLITSKTRVLVHHKPQLDVFNFAETTTYIPHNLSIEVKCHMELWKCNEALRRVSNELMVILCDCHHNEKAKVEEDLNMKSKK